MAKLLSGDLFKLLLLLFFQEVSCIVVDLPRGVPQSKALRFSDVGDTQGVFSCDGLQSIGFDKINDNFCDCPGGEDEPGTSACASLSPARFYCLNKGHRGRWIPSSRVDDEICDCCDGSDEITSMCDNTCHEEALVSNAAASQRIRILEDGAREKARYIETGEAHLKNQKDRLNALNIEIEDIHSKLRESAKLEHELEETQEKMKKEHQVASNMKVFHRFPTLSGLGLDELRNLLIEYARRVDLKGKQLMCLVTGQEDLCSEDAPDHSIDHSINYDDEDILDHANDYDGYGDMYGDMYGEYDDHHGYGEDHWSGEYDDGQKDFDNTPTELLDEETTYVFAEEDNAENSGDDNSHTDTPTDYLASEEPPFELTELTALRKAMKVDRKKLKELEISKKDIQGDLSTPVELFHLKGKCFSIKQHSYVYEMCPFGEATQKGDSGATSLGTMDEFSNEGEESKVVFTFVDGSFCYNGPDRSLIVDVECGVVDEILEVDEPRTCEYMMRFSSPVACDVNHAKALELEKMFQIGDEEAE